MFLERLYIFVLSSLVLFHIVEKKAFVEFVNILSILFQITTFLFGGYEQLDSKTWKQYHMKF